MHTLQDATVLCVGGSSGIGLATAVAAAEAGASVVIAGRTSRKLDAAAERIPGGAKTLAFDVADEDAVRDALRGLGRVDHCLITAAPVTTGPFRSLPTDKAEAFAGVKFWGAYRVSKYVDIADRGSLTFVTGQWSRRPVPGVSIAAAVNAGLEGLARALAVELAPLRVNSICPGLVETPLHAQYMANKDQRRAMYEAAAEKLPLGRIARAEDVAQAALYLMTNLHVTGQTLVVDGGSMLA